MTELTTAADLAWRVAALEARRGGAAAISPDHLLVALLSLEKLVEPSAGLEPERREAVRQEHERLTGLLTEVRLDAAALRRAIRARIPTGDAPLATALHRDLDCRALFERGAALAEERGNVPCGVLHLLAAALEAPTSALLSAIPRPDDRLLDLRTPARADQLRDHADRLNYQTGRPPDPGPSPTPGPRLPPGPEPPGLLIGPRPTTPAPWPLPGPPQPIVGPGPDRYRRPLVQVPRSRPCPWCRRSCCATAAT